MPTIEAKASASSHRLTGDLWKFWAGQTILNFGSSFTIFALPLLVFKLTHSTINLDPTTACCIL